MANIVRIDKYGWPLVKNVVPDEAWHWYEYYYIVDAKTQGTTYKCFLDTPKRVIWRETVQDGVTTLEFGYGAWKDRATLEYAPINGSLEVDLDA